MARLLHWIELFREFLMARLRRGQAYGLAFTVGLVLTVASLAIFLWIGQGLDEIHAGYPVDVEAQEFAREVREPGHVGYVRFITNLGGTRGTLVWAAVLGIFLLFWRRWYALFGLLFTSTFGGVVSEVLKLIFRRDRPIEKVIPAAGYSFPSGHAFAAIVFFGYCIYLVWTLVDALWARILLTLICLAFLLAIGFSRVYLNVHFLTDVLGGFISGLVWLLSCIFLIRWIENRRSMLRG